MPFVGDTNVLEIKHKSKINTNAYNITNAHQRNEHIGNWDRVKYQKINKRPKKGMTKKGC